MSGDQHHVQPDNTASDLDRRFLNAAIELGYNYIGRTAPNPSVGAIIAVSYTHLTLPTKA